MPEQHARLTYFFNEEGKLISSWPADLFMQNQCPVVNLFCLQVKAGNKTITRETINNMGTNSAALVHFNFFDRRWFGELIVLAGERTGYLINAETMDGEHYDYRSTDQAFKLQTIIDGTQAGTWEWNVQTGEVVFNERWAQIIGYQLDELAPVSIETWRRFVHPSDLTCSESALAAHFSGEQPFYSCDTRMRHRDGHWIWVRDYGRIVTRTPAGEPEWVTGSHIDITEHMETLSELKNLRTELQEILDNSPTVSFTSTVPEVGRYSFLSSGVENLLGYRAETFLAQPELWLKLMHPADLHNVQRRQRRWQDNGFKGTSENQYRMQTREGHYIWVFERLRRVKPEGEDALKEPYFIGSLFDITENIELHARLDALARVTPGVIYQFAMRPDGSAYFPYASHHIMDIYGVTPEEVANDAGPVFSVLHPDDMDHITRTIQESATYLNDWVCEYRVVINGQIRWLYGHSIPEKWPDGTIVWSGMIIDISERKTLELKLQKESTTDSLTGVYNRRYFMLQFEKEISRIKREDSSLALLSFDFDFFKNVNDTFGHETGDKVLCATSRAIKKRLRPYDTLARLGGEEFSILLPDVDAPKALKIAESLRKVVQDQRIEANGQPVPVTITIGVACANANDADIATMMRLSDQNLYKGKASGRNCVV